MNTGSVLLVIELVAEGIGVAKEIADIARRVKAGKEITLKEIEAARKAVNVAVADWDAARRDKE
jgi:hypothetical protein